MEKEKLNKLCNFVISHDDLTTKDLRSLNISYRNQRELINNRVLQRVRIGHYELIDYDAFISYGHKLFKKGEIKKASKCFDKAHEINPKHYENTFYFFEEKVYEKDYIGAYNCLKQHLTHKNINHTNNLYLLLLSHLIKLPDGNSEYVKHFDVDDLSIGKTNKSKEYIQTSSQIMFDIIHGRFTAALKGIKINKKHRDIRHYITYRLVSDIIEKNSTISFQINKMIFNKDYHSVINLLEEEQKAHPLTDYHDSILSLCYDIKSMKENKEAFQSEGEFYDISGNIYGHNYEMAKKEINKNGNGNYSILGILLDECINLRDYTNKINQGIVINYFTLASDLYSEDYDKFFDDLHFYLYGKDMLDHEEKFAQLVEMHKKEEDKLSLIPMKYLELIEGNDSPDICNFFIDKFNNSFTSKDQIATEVYFDIVSKFNYDGVNIKQNKKEKK